MSGRRYIGERYSFYRAEDELDSGGNGAVFDVYVDELDYDVVAKFFKYEGYDKVRRYERFKKEIEFAQKYGDIAGIMPIIDYSCPSDVPKGDDEAWYLMRKAETYKVNRRKKLIDKIDDMLSLAYIIQRIHSIQGKEYAHRDIKPENILILDGEIVLSDYGLIWNDGEDRITKVGERIGPYKISPPELEDSANDPNIDFRKSDVYLFAKVLWMTLKNDFVGFRGCYNRGDNQIYLDRKKYNVETLEPIHMLMEGATYTEHVQRITIGKCIEYLKIQKRVIDKDKGEGISDDQIRKLKYEEYKKEIISKNTPSELSFEDKAVIYEMLRGVVPIADIFVKGLGDDKNGKRIYVSDFVLTSTGKVRLVNYYNGRRINEYMINIKKMIHSNENGDIILELDNLNIEEEGYVSFAESNRVIGSTYSKIYLTADEKVILKNPADMVSLDYLFHGECGQSENTSC